MFDKFKLRDTISGRIAERITQRIEGKPFIVVEQIDKELQVVLEPDYLYIKPLEIYAFCGTVCRYQEEEKEYQPDCDIVIFYDPETGAELYSEIGSALYICVLNYCHNFDKSYTLEMVENMVCEWIEDDGKFLEQYVIEGSSYIDFENIDREVTVEFL